MRFDSLAAWLGWIEQLHPVAIDPGLERTAAVARSMGLDRPGVPVFTVAGTNGKGSVCAFLEAILGAAGYRVGLYTSPHLARFNERVRVGGVEAGDDALCEAFDAVDRARADTSLTYFEFATLAALAHFRTQAVDVLVLETGLGGRLDATNIIDADVSVVTSIDRDHTEWLGSDLDAIAREKAGIARPDRPLVLGMREPPAGLRARAEEIGARVYGRGAAFDLQPADETGRWTWHGFGQTRSPLPEPALTGGYQRDNAALALAALAALDRLPAMVPIADGLRTAMVRGRFERHDIDGVEVILDVAHNPAAAAVLAATLADRPCDGRTLAVFGMYRDKDIDRVIAALGSRLDCWYPAGLPPPRGLGGDETATVLHGVGLGVAAPAADPVAGYRAALAAAVPGDRVVVLGSFATVAPVSGLFL
ncbi:MAG: bifunctional tetrahydrofolate synthase/dihydrofolate synthase [Halofilum sp. (in: g-proteobacteria)]